MTSKFNLKKTKIYSNRQKMLLILRVSITEKCLLVSAQEKALKQPNQKSKNIYLSLDLLFHIMSQNLRSSPEPVMSASLLVAINGLCNMVKTNGRSTSESTCCLITLKLIIPRLSMSSILLSTG